MSDTKKQNRPTQATKDPDTARKARTIAFLVFYIALACAAIYSVKFYVGVSSAGDDAAYSNFAYYVSSTGFAQSTDSLSVRIMQYYPIAFFYLISNYSRYAGADWDITCYLATVAVVFYAGKELYNEYVGALASVLIAAFPAVAILSTTMSDNPPVMFFSALAMLSLLYGTRRKSGFWYAISGISLIAALAVMPLGFMAVAIAFFYVLVEAVRKKLDRKVLYFAIGLIIGLAMLSTFNYVNARQPLITFTTTFGYFQSTTGSNRIIPANGYLKFYPNVMFPYKIISVVWKSISKYNFNPVSIWKTLYIVNYNQVGFYFYATMLAMLYLLYRREKRAYFVFFWLAIGFLLMEFDFVHISLFPFHYILQHRLDRYVTFIAPPAVILTSMALVRFMDSAKKGAKSRYARYLLVGLIVTFIIATAIPIILLYHNILSLQGSYELKAAQYMASHSSNYSVYMINGEGSFIPTYLRFSKLVKFSTPEQADCNNTAPNSYVVVPKYGNSYGSTLCQGWQAVFTSNESASYGSDVIGPAMPFELRLYYVPQANAGVK